MELKHFLDTIYKKLWLMVLIPVVFAGITAVVSLYILEPEYESITTMYLANTDPERLSPGTYDNMFLYRQMIRDYSEIVKSKRVMSDIIDQLSLKDLTYLELKEKISIGIKGETTIIEIKVSDTDAERAKVLADKVSEVFIEKLRELIKIDGTKVVDSAEIPDRPVRPKTYLNITAALLIGLFTAVGSAFFIEYLDDTIKTQDDVEKCLGLSVLGRIPHINIK